MRKLFLALLLVASVVIVKAAAFGSSPQVVASGPAICDPDLVFSGFCDTVPPIPPGSFRHIVYIIQENRAANEMFEADPNLVTEGMTLQNYAPMALQTVGTGAVPSGCIGINLGSQWACIMFPHYPLTHVPLTYGTPGNATPESYDMDHTHGGWLANCGSGKPNANACNNAGWGDLNSFNCKGSGGATPCPQYASCKDGTASCAPGGGFPGCASPTPSPPTPTPFPTGVAAPSPQPTGYACGLAFLNSSDVQPLWTMAETYAVADAAFQTNQSPSWPSHLYATSGGAFVSPAPSGRKSGPFFEFVNNLSGDASGLTGCDHPPDPQQTYAPSSIDLINGGRSQAEPCAGSTSMFDTLTTAGVTFKYYASQDNPYGQSSYRNALNSYQNWGCTWGGGTTPPPFPAPTPLPTSLCPSQYTSHIGLMQDPWNTPSTNSSIITDISNCALEQVSWVTPTSLSSDHAAVTDGSGPAFVAAVVNAIGESTACDSGAGYWKDTAIIVTWDDWGGWFDPVAPTIYNKAEDGFRLPFIVISPYARPQYVSHVKHEAFGSVLRFIESNFSVPPIGTTDVPCPNPVNGGNLSCSDDLSDMFNFAQAPLSYNPIAYNLAPSKEWGIVAVRVKGADGAWGWRDTTPRAVERYIAWQQKHDRKCVDECPTGAL